jgi:hypothetical protein
VKKKNLYTTPNTKIKQTKAAEGLQNMLLQLYPSKLVFAMRGAARKRRF